MKKSRLLGAVCACLAAASFSVNAASIVDNGTYTTVDGVDWLDLTETAGMSYNDVIAQMAPGGAYEGWQYATRTELEGLWTAFGGDPNHYAGWSAQNNGLFDNLAPLFGDLYCAQVRNACALGEGHSWWIMGDEGSVGERLWALSQEDPGVILPDTVDYFNTSLAAFEEDHASNEAGSALIRAAAVPVPAAAWLFGSGLLGLVGIARRKKAA